MSQFIEAILFAEFDIDKGSVLRQQYPEKVTDDEGLLAELMLPEGTHNHNQDWTIFMLNRPSPEPVQARFVPPPQTTPVTEDPPDPPTWTPASPPPAMKPRSPPRSPPRVPDLEQTASNSPMEMATPRGDADNSLEAARAAAVVAAATPMPAPPVQRRRSVEPCLAEVIDGLKLKPAQAESLEQLLDEHEVHDLATAQILDAEDFKEIGIKVGTRKKLLERLASSASEA